MFYGCFAGVRALLGCRFMRININTVSIFRNCHSCEELVAIARPGRYEALSPSDDRTESLSSLGMNCWKFSYWWIQIPFDHVNKRHTSSSMKGSVRKDIYFMEILTHETSTFVCKKLDGNCCWWFLHVYSQNTFDSNTNADIFSARNETIPFKVPLSSILEGEAHGVGTSNLFILNAVQPCEVIYRDRNSRRITTQLGRSLSTPESRKI